MTDRLPEFANPPLHEVVFSLVLRPLRWRVPHFGLYWAKIRKDLPNFDVKQPVLPGQTEEMLRSGGNLQIQFESDPEAIRCWFINADNTRLIQIQKDRFTQNWRRVIGDEVYPRYRKELRPSFCAEWEKFAAFVKEEGIGECVIASCELTYFNQIDADDNWRVLGVSGQSEEPLSLWSGKTTDGFLGKPSAISLHARYPFPQNQGGLAISSNPVVNLATQKKAIQLKMHATGMPTAENEFMAWFDLAHEWIVRGFADVTTPAMHKLWGRK